MSRNFSRKIYLIAAVLGTLILFHDFVSAQSPVGNAKDGSAANSPDRQTIEKKQQQIENLQQKADTYRQLIELNQDKTETLENQLKLIGSRITALENDVVEIQREIGVVDQGINNLSEQVNAKQKEIDKQKAVLSQLFQAHYKNDSYNTIEILFKSSSISEFVNQTDYISQSGSEVKKMLVSITEAKYQLDAAKSTLEAKNDQQKEQREDISRKKLALDSEQLLKRQLLEETDGQEQKYQKLLERAEQQKQELLGDIEELSQQKSSELTEIKSKLKKPESGLASVSWYFNQQDPEWGERRIGFSNSLMKSYGCAVTALSMILKYRNVEIDPGTLARQPIFSRDLIVWPELWKNVKLASSIAHGNIDWNTVDKEIKSGNPVIIYVKAEKKAAGHYVVVHSKDKNGDYVVHDPIFGSNIFLSSTKEYVKALYSSDVVVDQMIIYH